MSLINMFISNYPEVPCSVAPMYEGQKGLQTFLILMASTCVPWMLVIKPHLIYRKKSTRDSDRYQRDPHQLSHKREDLYLAGRQNMSAMEKLVLIEYEFSCFAWHGCDIGQHFFNRTIDVTKITGKDLTKVVVD